VSGWTKGLDAKGQKHLMAALGIAEWAYYGEHEGTDWVFASPIGLAMLGLEPPPRAPELATGFEARPDLSVVAGAGLPVETRVPLFRYGTIRKIGQVCEFRLDRKNLAAASPAHVPGDELREALRALEPLPTTIVNLLGTKSLVKGKVAIRWCSALVKPEN